MPPLEVPLSRLERFLLPVADRVIGRFRPRPQHFADALFATTGDVRSYGLLSGLRVDPATGWPLPAFVLGAWYPELRGAPPEPILCDGSRHPHVAVIAPSGGGKTWQSWFSTALLSFSHSALFWDIKGELWTRTSALRSHYGRVLRFAPAEVGSAKYNPLDAVRPAPYAVGDARNLVEHIAPDKPGSAHRDSFFDDLARPYVAATVLFVLDVAPPEERNLAGVASALARGKALGEAMKESTHPDPGVRRFIAESAARVWDSESERTVGSIVSTAHSYLAPFTEPLMAENTATSDFLPSDLMCGEAPMSVYLCTSKPDLPRCKPLLRVLLSQCMSELQARETTDRDGKPKRWKLALMLDELPTLGKLGNLADDLVVMRSAGIRAMLGCQGLGQLKAVYGDDAATILNNCRLVFGRPNSLAEGKEISGLLGEVTEVRRSWGWRSGSLDQSEGASEAWRCAVQPAEVCRMPRERFVVMGEDRPILATRTPAHWWLPLVGEPPG